MRNITFSLGETYHLYNRGTEHRQIFTDERDYERFLALLYLCNGTNAAHLQIQGRTLKEVLADPPNRGTNLVDIGAYCLMPNHFHLVVREKEERGISKFMQKLGSGYTGYFNTLNQRNGALFQGKFKAKHAGTNRYLSYLLAYVHLNPVKLVQPGWKKMRIEDLSSVEEYLERYPYSSYRDYLGHSRLENVLINKEALPAYVETSEDFRSTYRDWLEYQNASIEVGP